MIKSANINRQQFPCLKSSSLIILAKSGVILAIPIMKLGLKSKIKESDGSDILAYTRTMCDSLPKLTYDEYIRNLN